MKIGPKLIGSFIIVSVLMIIASGIAYWGIGNLQSAADEATGRYGSFRDEGAEWNGHFSFGAGYVLVESVELRFETLIAEQSSENINIFQLVAGF